MILLTTITLATLGTALQSDTPAVRPVAALFVHPSFDARPIWWASAPHAVLYEDGAIIYAVQDSGEAPTYATATLPPSAFAAFLDSLALSPGFFELRDWYSNLPANYEPWSYTVWAWDGKQGKRVSLEGLLDSTARLFAPNSPGTQPRTPKAFVNAARRLLDFRRSGATPWQPAQFEIVLSEDSDSDAPTDWPSDWPAFDGPDTFVDRRGGYHVPLSESQLAAYLTCCVHALFDLGGKRWRGIARPVFPGDRFWSY